VYETAVPPRPTARLLSVVNDDDVDRFRAALARAGAALGPRTLWHINSTAEGGGVAELLRANLGYLVGDGLRVRWAIFEGDPRFFQITKRIHNRLHGDLGDGGELGTEERTHYDWEGELRPVYKAKCEELVAAGYVLKEGKPMASAKAKGKGKAKAKPAAKAKPKKR